MVKEFETLRIGKDKIEVLERDQSNNDVLDVFPEDLVINLKGDRLKKICQRPEGNRERQPSQMFCSRDAAMAPDIERDPQRQKKDKDSQADV